MSFKRAVSIVLVAATLPSVASAAALRTGMGGPGGFGELFVAASDDASSPAFPITSTFPAGLQIGAATYDSLFVNNNGNVSFASPLSTYTANPAALEVDVIAPFFGDADTRNRVGLVEPTVENLVWYYSGPEAFVATWNMVGFYSQHNELQNSFQVVLTPAGSSGDFDAEFRYAACAWTTGDASGGADGFGGTPAAAGIFLPSLGFEVELPGSGTAQVLELCTGSNVGEPGVWRYQFRGGVGAICGDGTVDAGEGCDDGNTADGDGCSATCQGEFDTDGDGFWDFEDNCVDFVNPEQADADTDGLGDLCDSDDDGDSVDDSVDNCPRVANANQADLDGDTVGDVCDTDIDGDGFGRGDDCNDRDPDLQAFVLVYPDPDDDDFGTSASVLSLCRADAPPGFTLMAGDNCPDDTNADQADTDEDGEGDACDADRDGDDIPEDGDASGVEGDLVCTVEPFEGCDDNCGDVANPDQADADADGVGDVCLDTDGDGVVDALDVCPEVADSEQADADGDGAGDLCDDSDGDGLLDVDDACPEVAADTDDGCPVDPVEPNAEDEDVVDDTGEDATPDADNDATEDGSSDAPGDADGETVSDAADDTVLPDGSVPDGSGADAVTDTTPPVNLDFGNDKGGCSATRSAGSPALGMLWLLGLVSLRRRRAAR